MWPCDQEGCEAVAAVGVYAWEERKAYRFCRNHTEAWLVKLEDSVQGGEGEETHCGDCHEVFYCSCHPDCVGYPPYLAPKTTEEEQE